MKPKASSRIILVELVYMYNARFPIENYYLNDHIPRDYISKDNLTHNINTMTMHITLIPGNTNIHLVKFNT